MNDHFAGIYTSHPGQFSLAVPPCWF